MRVTEIDIIRRTDGQWTCHCYFDVTDRLGMRLPLAVTAQAKWCIGSIYRAWIAARDRARRLGY